MHVILLFGKYRLDITLTYLFYVNSPTFFIPEVCVI